jgi:hypothetical protein
VSSRICASVSGIGISYPHLAGEHGLSRQRAVDVATPSGRLYELLRGAGSC